MSKDKQDEVGLTEMAAIMGCSRGTAYVRARSGEIPGARLVAGRLWVAPRRAVVRYREDELRRNAPGVLAAS